MEKSSFVKQLALIACILTIIQLVLNNFSQELANHQSLFWISQIFFIFLCIISFIGGKYFVHKANKNWFSQFIVILIFVRLVSSIAIILGYFNIYQPKSKLFLLPFFFVYITYTIFEVYFLSKIGREN